MPYPHLSELAIEKKPERVTGLLRRLFGANKFIILFRNCEVELSSSEKEKMAILFEFGLNRLYAQEAYEINVSSNTLFENTDDAAEKSQYIVRLMGNAFGKAADQRIPEGHSAVEEYFKDKEFSQLKAMNRLPVSCSADLNLLAEINRKLIPRVMSLSIFIATMMLRFFDKNLAMAIVKSLNFKKYAYDYNLLLPFSTQTNEESILKKHYEEVFFKLGLLPVEYNPIVDGIIKWFKELVKINKFLEEVDLFCTRVLDKKYVFFQCENFFLKASEQPCGDDFFKAVDLEEVLAHILTYELSLTSGAASQSPGFEPSSLSIFNVINDLRLEVQNQVSDKAEAQFTEKFKGLYGHVSYFRRHHVTRVAHQFFYKAALEKAILQYEKNKNEMTQDQVLIIFLVQLYNIDYFIRWHRPDFDAVCESKGLKESLQIQSIIDRNPDITLNALKEQAKTAGLVLMSPQSVASTLGYLSTNPSPNPSPRLSRPRNNPFDSSSSGGGNSPGQSRK